MPVLEVVSQQLHGNGGLQGALRARGIVPRRGSQTLQPEERRARTPKLRLRRGVLRTLLAGPFVGPPVERLE